MLMYVGELDQLGFCPLMVAAAQLVWRLRSPPRLQLRIIRGQDHFTLISALPMHGADIFAGRGPHTGEVGLLREAIDRDEIWRFIHRRRDELMLEK